MANTKRICSVAGCDKPVHIELRGWCRAHYMRWVRYRNPLAGGPKQSKAAFGAPKAFIEHALLHEGNACLEWPFAKDTDGYGVLKVDGELKNAHREVCRMAHGEPPTPSHEAAHGFEGKPCSGPACVNPKHLRWATRSENELDKKLHAQAA